MSMPAHSSRKNSSMAQGDALENIANWLDIQTNIAAVLRWGKLLFCNSHGYRPHQPYMVTYAWYSDICADYSGICWTYMVTYAWSTVMLYTAACWIIQRCNARVKGSRVILQHHLGKNDRTTITVSIAVSFLWITGKIGQDM